MPNPKNANRRTSYVIFFPLLFIMFIFEIMHLPAAVAPYRPDFVATVLIFFAITDPKRVNVGLAWFAGLILDLLSGAPMGIHGLIFAFQVYIIVAQFKHFAAFMVWQQMIIIGIVNFIAHIGVYWIGHLIGQPSYSSNFSWQALATMLCWPVFMLIYRFLWVFFNVTSASVKSEKEI